MLVKKIKLKKKNTHIITCNKQTNAIRTFIIPLGAQLHSITNFDH